MTQPNEAVGGSDEPIIAAEPTIEDRFAAIAEEPQEEEAPGDQPPEQGDTPDELPEPELDDEPDEEADEPLIPAPVSWTAEEKEEFSKLPRELQETLTRREAEREKGYHSKTQEAKQQRVQVEQAALALIQQTQATHTQVLQALLPDIPEKPSYALQAQDPATYAALMDAHENAVYVRNYVAQELQKIEQTSQAQQQAVKAYAAQVGAEMLQEKFPEFLDPEKGPELRNQLRSTALALGYTDEQLAQTDAQDVIAMKQVSEWKAKADKYDTAMAKQMQRVREGKNPPKISRPGAPQGKGVAANRQYTADRQAMRGGDRDAAARVFGKFL